MILFYISKIQH